jgi:phosphoribosylaminoimidazole (AIR) synthetase
VLRRSLGDASRDILIASEPEHELARLGEVLLTPTRIYARQVLAVRAALRAAGHDLRGVAHITGGGLPGNVARALAPDLGARLDPARWTMPSIMWLIGAWGGLEEVELRATFNGGIGMVLVVAPEAVGVVMAVIPEAVAIGVVAALDDLGARYVEVGLASRS